MKIWQYYLGYIFTYSLVLTGTYCITWHVETKCAQAQDVFDGLLSLLSWYSLFLFRFHHWWWREIGFWWILNRFPTETTSVLFQILQSQPDLLSYQNLSMIIWRYPVVRNKKNFCIAKTSMNSQVTWTCSLFSLVSLWLQCTLLIANTLVFLIFNSYLAK